MIARRYPIHMPTRPKHATEVLFLTALIIDLKLQLAGAAPVDPITAARLETASHCVAQISACEETDDFYLPKY